MNHPPCVNAPLRIILVEDSEDDADLIALALRRSRLECTIECVETAPEFEQRLADRPAVILCDYHLPRFSCEAALATARRRSPVTPFVVVSRHVGDAEAASLLRFGAAALVRKDRLHELAPAIMAALAPAPGRPPPPRPSAG